MRHALIALTLALAGLCLGRMSEARAAQTARVSYYVESGPMYVHGDWTYPGAASCSSWLWDHWVHIVEADVWVYCGDWGDPSYFEAATSVDVYSPDGRPWWLDRGDYTIEVY